MGAKIVVWILVSLLVLFAAIILTICSMLSQWVWQGDDMRRWEGDLNRINTPGLMFTLLELFADTDELEYPALADIFCDGPNISITENITEYYCDMFEFLDFAGWLYSTLSILFFIFAGLQIIFTVLALTGRTLLPRWVFISTTCFIMIFNLSAFLSWTIITDAWFDNECEENIFVDQVEICAGEGLKLAMSSSGVCVLNVVLFITAFSIMPKEKYYVKMQQPEVVELTN